MSPLKARQHAGSCSKIQHVATWCGATVGQIPAEARRQEGLRLESAGATPWEYKGFIDPKSDRPSSTDSFGDQTKYKAP